MIWLLVPLVAACMAYVCLYVWRLETAFLGPDIPGPPPPQPDPAPRPVVGPHLAAGELTRLLLDLRHGAADWDAAFRAELAGIPA